MIIKRIWKSVLPAFGLLALLGSVQAEEIHPYSEPIQIPEYVTDIEQLLAGSFERYGWILEAQQDGTTYKGALSYKEYEVRVTVTVENGQLTLVADSAHAADCSSACPDLRDDAHVYRWITNLRRSIAVDLTHRVKAYLSS